MSRDNIKTDGLIIRAVDFSETSRVVTFFTRDFGKISTLAKGAKRLKSSFDAALDLLSQCQIVFIHKSTTSLDILTEARLIDRFRASTQDVNVYYAGLYVAELLLSCTEEFDPYPRLYAAAVATLKRLPSEDFRPQILRFELTTLAEMGLLPEFEQCQCGRPVRNDQERWSVWIQQGVLLCSQCRKPEMSSRPLTGTLLVQLHRLIEDDELPTISNSELKSLRHLVTALISNTLDRRPTMLSYLRF